MTQYNPLSYGRWYKFFIESDGTDYTLTSYDLTSSIVTGKLKLPKDMIICDISVQAHLVKDGTGSTAIGDQYGVDSTDGSPLITLPTVDDFDYCTVFVFAYKA